MYFTGWHGVLYSVFHCAFFSPQLPYNIALSICVSLSAHLSGSQAQDLYPWIFSFSVIRQCVGFNKYSENTCWMNKWLHILACHLKHFSPAYWGILLLVPSLPFQSLTSLSLSTSGFLLSTFIYFLSSISLAHCIPMIALLHMIPCSSFMES